MNPFKLKNWHLPILLSISTLLLGMLLLALHQEWIIFRSPSFSSTSSTNGQLHTRKKNIKLTYWHKHQWHSETVSLLWSTDTSLNITYLVNSWLTLLEEEGIITSKTVVQSTMLSASEKEAYISFDRSPLNPQQATYDTWMTIEGLLTTLRDNEIPITSLFLLVHHQPLVDDHLDFSCAWPITGFTNV